LIECLMSNGDRKKFTQEWEIARFLVTSCSTPNGDRRKFTLGELGYISRFHRTQRLTAIEGNSLSAVQYAETPFTSAQRLTEIEGNSHFSGDGISVGGHRVLNA